MPLQVIAGEARGRRLKSPPGGVRPTAAMVRRALFDILGSSIRGAAVLDLYAGAGTVGIEALSRGAASCDFVERDRRCATVIRANLDAVGLAAGGRRGRVHCASAEVWLRRRLAALAAYHLIFLDPPYGDPGVNQALSILAQPALLAPESTVVLEARSGRPLPLPDGLVAVRTVSHGDSALTFLRPPK